MNKIIFGFFIVFSVLFITRRPDSIVEVEKAEKTSLALRHLRVSLEKYYQEEKTFPKNLKEDMKFMEIYSKEELEGTQPFGEEKENNEVHILTDFQEGDRRGGWNYNPDTGEIRANLEFDAYHQRIEWSMM